MEKSRKVKLIEEEKVVELKNGGRSGRKLVKGIMIMDEKNEGKYVKKNKKKYGVNLKKNEEIEKELLKSGK